MNVGELAVDGVIEKDSLKRHTCSKCSMIREDLGLQRSVNRVSVEGTSSAKAMRHP
jgi:hypothetical protein